MGYGLTPSTVSPNGPLLNKDTGLHEPTMYIYSEQLHHPPHQSLMEEAETVSKMLESHSILTWLSAHEDVATFTTMKASHLMHFLHVKDY